MYIAEVTFWGQDKGGRFTPPQPGFRPQLKIGNIHTSCTVGVDDDSINKFDFDEKYVVNLDLQHQEHYGNVLGVGDLVQLFEGSKQIAEGIVTKVY